jgi:hypothetical protein
MSPPSAALPCRTGFRTSFYYALRGALRGADLYPLYPPGEPKGVTPGPMGPDPLGSPDRYRELRARQEHRNRVTR